ncbi:MAG: DUF302 domain-containing protein [Aquificaceae bacterium]|nr:DUF302 domain-containing protein [Aquificaceae bacterium]
MLIKLTSEKSIGVLRQVIEEKAKQAGFGVMSVHDVSGILQSKGVPINYPCVIIEVCSPRHASQVLSKNPSIATAMPCRIALYESEGKTVIETIAPTKMLEAYEEPELKPVAEEVEELLTNILKESA